jgi:3-hydroxyacyl-CoA dehydrogenase
VTWFMGEKVRFHTQDSVGIITVDNPPVNALSKGVPEGIRASLEAAKADTAVKAVVLIGAGRTFIAGADIGEFAESIAAGKPGGPDLHELLAAIEDCPKPVVVAIHGSALGGGLEIALAGHYRVATPDAQVGLPEANLGIIPGAEGTQRLPRLTGLAKAIDMLVTGAPVKALEAQQAGIIDRVIDGDLLAGAIAFAKEAAEKRGLHPKTRERNDKLGTPEENASLLASGREQARKIRRNQTAPLFGLQALEAAVTLPFDEGCRREKQLSNESLASEQAKALIHAFLAERAVSKIPGIPKDTPTYQIRKAAIIGAGTMGAAISTALANAGISVILKDTTQDALDRGIANLRRNYESPVKRGRMTQEEAEKRIAMVRSQLGYEGFDEADLIIEAVFEDMPLKKQIFSEIDRIAKADCVLATNTSTLDIDEIASATSRPQMVIGLHFFSPAHIMRLVEIVKGKATSSQVIATAFALAKALKKVGVLVGNCYGFVGNRMMFPYMREAQFLVEEGATPAQVDAALTGWGMAMGIFAVDDMGGLDVLWRVRQDPRHWHFPDQRKPVIHEKVYQLGRLGQKTGAGWYRYDENRKATPDPEIEQLVRKVSIEAGIPQRKITNEEIIERCLYTMINEGARILEEGYAVRAADIDVIYLNGYGFPAYRGGPMWYADTAGLKNIYGKIEEFRKQHGKLWTPAPLLKQLAEEGKTFAEWDAAKEAGAAKA